MIVCGAGTGGTITGLSRKIIEKCPGCKVSLLMVNTFHGLPISYHVHCAVPGKKILLFRNTIQGHWGYSIWVYFG